MGEVRTQGFTIIESLLFLAISGLMMVTMIAGTSVALNTQRYNDSVRSFKTLLQEQYAQVTSTQNDRTEDIQCGVDGTAIPVENEGGQQYRGQSDCEMVGRYVIVRAHDIEVYTVLAYRDSSAATTGSDVAKMRDASYMTFGVDEATVQRTALEWGAQISWPRTGAGAVSPTTPRTLGFLVIRSPDSGQTFTFTSDTVPEAGQPIRSADIQSMIVADATTPGQADRTVCIDSDGLTLNSTSFVYLYSFASGPSSVEVRTNDYNAGVGVDTRC